MRQPVGILRCKCLRCRVATRRGFLLGLAFCLTVAATWKLLLFDHRFAPTSRDYFPEIRAEANEFPPFDQSSENTGLRLPNPVLDSGPREKKGQPPYQRLNRERFNAALAAGLIDRSKIEIETPSVPGLNPSAEHWLTLNSPGVSMQNPPAGLDSGPPVTASADQSADSAAANPTKPIDATSTMAMTMDKPVPTSLRQSAATAPDGMTPTAPRRQTVQIARNKPVAVGLIARTGNSSQESLAARENQHLHNSSSHGPPAESSGDPAIDRSPSRELSENIQRFASDFVRANQTEDFREQHRFFADSVHFYREGDLSLAGVEAATRRYRRDQQSKHPEVAGPAVATGPVNGGFFVIQQPVRWTESQGSKITRHQSVLHLRVVPVSHGDWKITSIDETNR
jgi:hypothetical protein